MILSRDPRPPRPLSVRDFLLRAGPARPVTVGDPWTLRTPRLVLRPLAPSDRPEFMRVLRHSREHLARFFPLGSGRESDSDIFERHMRLTWFAGAVAPDWRRIAFTYDGRIAGGFNLNAIQRGLEFRAEANWWISRDMAGRGLATEGVEAMLRLAFRDISRGGLGLHRVDALVCPENEPSLRMVNKLGFIRQRTEPVPLLIGGVERPHLLFTRWVDVPEREPMNVSLVPGLREQVAAQIAAIDRRSETMCV